MTDKFRVGIIGANSTRGWASTAHIPAIEALTDFELTAVSTTRQESADETARRFGVPHAFANAEDLVRHPDVDIVAVCVKVPYHHELVGLALDAGKNVICEWPLGANLAEAEDLQKRAGDRGVRHAIGLQGRQSPMVNYVRDLVALGYVGQVLSCSLVIPGGGRGGPTVSSERVWSLDKDKGVTLLSITGGHSIDILRHCLGEFSQVAAFVVTMFPSVTVNETGETVSATSPDNAVVQGVLDNGALVSVVIRGGTPKSKIFSLEIQGSSGALFMSGEGSLHLSDAAFVLSGANAAGELEILEVPAKYQIVPEQVPAGPARNVAGIYLGLGEAIRNSASFSPSFDEATSLHRLLDAVERASSTGIRQSL